jgi:hypothetical protein
MNVCGAHIVRELLRETGYQGEHKKLRTHMDRTGLQYGPLNIVYSNNGGIGTVIKFLTNQILFILLVSFHVKLEYATERAQLLCTNFVTPCTI